MSASPTCATGGVRDVSFAVCDGLKRAARGGRQRVAGRDRADVCIIHLIRNAFRLTSKRDWDAMKRTVKPIYTAVNAAPARAELRETSASSPPPTSPTGSPTSPPHRCVRLRDSPRWPSPPMPWIRAARVREISW
jgi:Transposase, Mutator family